MVIHTERLTLRPWRETDAESLFAYASDPDVGPAAGWPPHRSVEESREIIRTVFTAPHTFAVCLAATDEPVGSIGLMPPRCESSDRSAELERGGVLGRKAVLGPRLCSRSGASHAALCVRNAWLQGALVRILRGQ